MPHEVIPRGHRTTKGSAPDVPGRSRSHSTTSPGSDQMASIQPPAASHKRRDGIPTGNRSGLAEAQRQAEQQAGIAALISLAVATASTAIIPAIPGYPDDRTALPFEPRGDSGQTGQQPQPDRAPNVSRGLVARLRSDHVLRSSISLILSYGIQAAFGFAFWIAVARLFSTEDVGRASSLISAATVIAYIGLIGLNTSIVRYLPTTVDKDRMITAGILAVFLGGAGVGLVYVLATPVIAPRLTFIQAPVLAAGFVAFAGAASVNLLTDSIFIAQRKASYAALTDGIIGGIGKIGAVFVLSGTGAYGLFSTSALGFAVAALSSLLLMAMALRWRPSLQLRGPLSILKPLVRFSVANYAGNIMNLLPTLFVPLIVLDRLGASAAAYYFVAYQMAALLYAAAYAVGQASLAEGSHDGVNWRKMQRRSRKVLTAICIPACLLMILSAHWLLLVFGPRYSQHATICLIALALATLPIAANNWLLTVLRLAGKLKAIIVSNVAYFIAICALAWFLAPYGLGAATAAWPLGSLAGAVVAAVAAPATRTAARHRRANSRRRSAAW